MKKLVFATLLMLSTTAIFAQADKIVGTWLSEEKDGKIEVYKQNGKYFGKLVWISEDVGPDGKAPKRDVNNPDAAKRNEPLKGKVLMKNLSWDEDDEEWTDGTIYDPKSGSTYSLIAWLEDPDTLYLKGYIGISLIGRSSLWTRVD